MPAQAISLITTVRVGFSSYSSKTVKVVDAGELVAPRSSTTSKAIVNSPVSEKICDTTGEDVAMIFPFPKSQRKLITSPSESEEAEASKETSSPVAGFSGLTEKEAAGI